MLNVTDLAENKELDSKTMACVRGGFDPFAHLGLTSMLSSIPGYSPPVDHTTPIEEIDTYSPGETIYVEDVNHTEITTSYPA